MPALREHLQVVRDGGLGELEERDQLAHAHLARVPAEHVHELHPDRVAERLRHSRHPLGLRPLDIGIDDRLAAWLAHGPLLLGRELQIDGHLFTYIN